MIDKKIWLLGGTGAIALSVAIAITFNIVVKNVTDPATQIPGQLSCDELQIAINNLGRPGLERLPDLVKDNITWLRMQGENCQLQGKNWLLANGNIQIQKTTKGPILGNETNDLSKW